MSRTIQGYEVFRIASETSGPEPNKFVGDLPAARAHADKLVEKGAYGAGVKVRGDRRAPWSYLTRRDGPTRPLATRRRRTAETDPPLPMEGNPVAEAAERAAKRVEG